MYQQKCNKFIIVSSQADTYRHPQGLIHVYKILFYVSTWFRMYFTNTKNEVLWYRKRKEKSVPCVYFSNIINTSHIPEY